MIKIYNTEKQQKEKFIPLEEKRVKMYVCGPTTYNLIHLGNARPIVVFDTIRRYFEYSGYDVTYVQNFTDVDDKIINRAAEENMEPLALAEKYIGEYFKDTEKLNIKKATHHPKVSENIPEIIAFVQGLIEKGFAYEVDGDVYYDIQKFDHYGKLSGRDLEDMQMGARINVDERKKHPGDFALWKSAKPGELFWESPWGSGRPGWHIECSVMSRKFLGDQFDIHGGGQDLVFPHHENEVAQTEAMTGKKMANYWMHNGFITINKEKMSKSLGNFFLLREILDRFDPTTVRFYLIETHYRSPLDFDYDKIEESGRALERIKNTYLQLKNYQETSSSEDESKKVAKIIEEVTEDFKEAMDDDFNTALAIAEIFDFTKEINKLIKKNEMTKENSEKLLSVYSGLLDVLGLD
ncbi:MAG: cysteine--tRNA ligase, partial [Eubacteriales bacterium]|nr:cysteine--tRNA ligase [Eubacteriales bacterium]